MKNEFLTKIYYGGNLCISSPVHNFKIKIKQTKTFRYWRCYVDLINFSSHYVLQFIPDCEPSSQTMHIPLHVLTDLFSYFSQPGIYS